MKVPRISIIMPCFNAARYLGEAIESVLQQNYPNLELLVIDDGSTDDSSRIIHTFGDALKMIFQPNQGVSVARNVGLQHATGDWIGFLDADDLMMPNTLFTIATAIQITPDAQLFWGKMTILYETHQPVIPFRLGTSGAAHMVQLGSMWCQNLVFKQVGFFDPALRLAEDSDWFMRLLDQKVLIHKLDHICVTYRRHSNNTTSASYFGDPQYYLALLKKSIHRKNSLKNPHSDEKTSN